MKRTDFLNARGEVDTIETQEAVYGLFGKYRCLSNFHYHPFKFEGLTFTTSEAAYMAQKTLDPAIKLQFANCLTGKEAKDLGKTIDLRVDWDDIHRIHAMYRVLFAKFSQDISSMQVLLSTGDKYIEETNWWGDMYWGRCNDYGFNHLGQVLMTIRNFIANQ